MLCPCCGTQMQKGRFENHEVPVQWFPEGSKYPPFRGGKTKGAIVLGGGGFLRGYKAEAYYCPRCRMAIVPEQ